MSCVKQENVDFVLYDGKQDWKAGEVAWNGSVYTDLEKVIDYSHDRKPVSEIDSLHFTNRSFIDELT